MKCNDVLLMICKHCGSFISRRFKDEVWFKLKNNLQIHWKDVKNRLSNTNVDDNIETRIINQILKCLILTLTPTVPKDEIEQKLTVNDKPSIKLTFDEICEDIIITILPFLNEKLSTQSISFNTIKVISLIANNVNFDVVIHHLFILCPHLFKKYFKQSNQLSIYLNPYYIPTHINKHPSIIYIRAINDDFKENKHVHKILNIQLMNPLNINTFVDKNCEYNKSERYYIKNVLQLLSLLGYPTEL